MRTDAEKPKKGCGILFLLLIITILAGCAGRERAAEDCVFYGDTNVFRIGSAAYEVCAFNEGAALSYAALVGETAEALSGETRVFCLIIPEACDIMPGDEERKALPEHTDTCACIASIYAAMPESVKKIAVWDKLKAHSEEAIFFRTDHHWTARGAYLGYEAFCEAAGIARIPLEEYRSVCYDGFLGSYFTESGGDGKLLPAETVEAFYPVSEGVTLTVTDEAGRTEVRPMVADVSEMPASAKYMTFAGGNNPFSVISDPEKEDGSVLILVKESFGNPMAAFLCGHYSTVYMIDYRYWDGNIIDFAREAHADDLLFLNSFRAADTGSGVGFLSMIVKKTG